MESAPGVLRGLRERDVPFMLMTNGGGYHESTRARSLRRGSVLRFTDQIIQSHTPMRELVPKYKDEPYFLWENDTSTYFILRRNTVLISREYRAISQGISSSLSRHGPGGL